MIRQLILGSLITFPGLSAMAAEYRCNFSGRLINLNYDSKTNAFLEKGSGYQRDLQNVRLHPIDRTQSVLRSAEGEVILELDRNFRGSDEISDIRYPYSAVLHLNRQFQIRGGCESGTLQAKGKNKLSQKEVDEIMKTIRLIEFERRED